LQPRARSGILAAANTTERNEWGARFSACWSAWWLAVLVIMAMEMLGHHFYPPPSGLDVTDPANEAAFAQFVATMPFGGKVMVLLAWLAGTFVGALAAAKIARHQTAAALLVALVVMSA
jgi:hypothetical protein